jgi:hypothetical protein
MANRRESGPPDRFLIRLLRKYGIQGRRQWRKGHLAMEHGHVGHPGGGIHPRQRWRRPGLAGGAQSDPRKGEATGTATADGADDTRRCHTAIVDRQARPIIRIRKMGSRGQRVARPQSPETIPCGPGGTTAGRSGRAGPGLTHDVGSRRRCPRRFSRTCGIHLRDLKAFGARIAARDPDRKTAEIQARIALTHRFNAFGTVEIIRGV